MRIARCVPKRRRHRLARTVRVELGTSLDEIVVRFDEYEAYRGEASARYAAKTRSSSSVHRSSIR